MNTVNAKGRIATLWVPALRDMNLPTVSAVGLALLCLVPLVAELWLLQRARRQAVMALAGLEQSQQERDRLDRQSPALNEHNDQAIARDLARARQLLAAQRAALRDFDGLKRGTSPPATPLDLFFAIATFVEQARATAEQAQVTLRPDEHFGFAEYAHAGPEAKEMPGVLRQLAMIRPLVEALLESGPHTLLGVKRVDSGRSALSGPSGSMEGAVYFDEAPSRPLRVPCWLRKETFLLEFTGQTPVLREFMTRLEGGRYAATVRCVQVGPLVVVRPPVPGATPVPVMNSALSQFSVEIECVEMPSAIDGNDP
jgi:hypothetical protein